MVDRDDINHDLLLEHIDVELESPKQRVSEIHNFANPDEERLRLFLRRAAEEVRRLSAIRADKS